MAEESCKVMPHIYDVVVVGLGGHGSAAAAHIAQRGCNTLGVDMYERTQSKGSSQGRSRIIRLAYYEDHRYVPLLRRSLELWKILNDRGSSSSSAEDPRNIRNTDTLSTDNGLLVMTGGLMIGLPDSEVIQGTIKSVEEHNLSHEILSQQDIMKRFPLFQVSADEIGVYESDAGYLVPESCIENHLYVAEEHGAVLKFGEKVVSWSLIKSDGSSSGSEITEINKKNCDQISENSSDSCYTVHTVCADGTKNAYVCRKIVVAAGPWSSELYGHQIEPLLHVERRVQYWFNPKRDDKEVTELFKNLPIYIWDAGLAGMFYGFPAKSGSSEGVKVAMHFQKSESSSAENTCTPDSLDRTVKEKEVNEMRDVLSSRIPDLAGELVDSAACMYTLTEDHHFLIDFHPTQPGVLLLSPCSGHGFKFCAVVGEIVADLIQNGKTKHDISLFSFQARKDKM